MHTQQMKVLSQVQIAPGIYEMQLDCGGYFEFQAGQYVLVHVHDKHNLSQKKPYPRAYSVASFEGKITPDGFVSAQQLSLIYKETGGVATTYLSRCRVGDTIITQGPAGHYTAQRHNKPGHTSLMFCATGTGIAPIHCILKSLTAPFQSSSSPVHNSSIPIPQKICIYWGLKTTLEAYLISSFRDIADKLQQAGVQLERVLCVSQENVPMNTSYEQWRVYGARVQPILIEKVGDLDHALFSLCGSGEMVSQTRQLLLASGLKSNQIIFERYS